MSAETLKEMTVELFRSLDDAFERKQQDGDKKDSGSQEDSKKRNFEREVRNAPTLEAWVFG